MRELPEPTMYAFLDGGRGIYIEGGPLGEKFFDELAVLAIQRQAYEDGLRDAIPDGYVLAPKDATLEMQWAGNDYAEQTANKPKGMWWWGRVYQAMLIASQKEAP